jgi:hypothetical protein
MGPGPSKTGSRWWRLCLAVGVVVLARYLFFVVAPAAVRPDTNGFAAYFTMARVLLTHPADLARVYDDVWFQSQIDACGFHHVIDMVGAQPPTMALLLAPFAWASPAAARLAWVLCSVGFWVAAVAALCRVLPGRCSSPRWTLGVLAVSTAYRPLRENLDRGQVYTLLLLLLVSSLVMLAKGGRRASLVAGVPLGVMVVVKSAGVWLLLMLLVSRRWRTVLVAAGTYVAVALLSLPVIGFGPWGAFLHGLVNLPGERFRYVTAYQTLGGLFGHLFVFDATWSPRPLTDAPLLATVLTLLGMALAMAQSRRFERGAPDSVAARLLALALFDSLVVTLAPIAEGYHYVLVFPAVVIAVSWAIERRVGARSWLVLGASLVVLTAPQRLYSHPAIQGGALALLAYPRVYGALLLWGWLGRALAGVARAPEGGDLVARSAPNG